MRRQRGHRRGAGAHEGSVKKTTDYVGGGVATTCDAEERVEQRLGGAGRRALSRNAWPAARLALKGRAFVSGFVYRIVEP